MIKKEWYWMLNLPQDKKDNKVGLKSYMCNMDDKNDDYQDHLEDGVDDFISQMFSDGLLVPLCFVERVTSLIKSFYDLDLKVVGKETNKSKGVFCSMGFNDKCVFLIAV